MWKENVLYIQIKLFYVVPVLYLLFIMGNGKYEIKENFIMDLHVQFLLKSIQL